MTTDEASDRLDESTLLSLIGNERRYACLHYLLTTDREPIPVRDLAEDIADELADEPPASENLENSVYISLCQTHLEKLASVELVDFDADEKTVRRGPEFHTFEAYVSEDDWSSIRTPTVFTSLLTVALLAALFVVPNPVQAYVLGGLALLHVLLLVLVGATFS